MAHCFSTKMLKTISFGHTSSKPMQFSVVKNKPNSASELLSGPVFYNENMQIGNKVINSVRVFDNVVYCIAHFLKDGGEFCTLEEFNTRFGTTVDFLTFCNCTSLIKQYIKKLDIAINDNKTHNVNVCLKAIHSVQNTRVYYNIFTNDDCMPNCCLKRNEKVKVIFSWNRVFIKVHKIKDVKLTWLQMLILATNIVLKEMGVAADTQCKFCSDEKDSIEDIFWRCVCVRRFWNSLDMILKDKCQTAVNVKMTENLVLFGVDTGMKTDSVFDLMILEAKQFIYRFKLDKCSPTPSMFLQKLMVRYDTY